MLRNYLQEQNKKKSFLRENYFQKQNSYQVYPWSCNFNYPLRSHGQNEGNSRGLKWLSCPRFVFSSWPGPCMALRCYRVMSLINFHLFNHTNNQQRENIPVSFKKKNAYRRRVNTQFGSEWNNQMFFFQSCYSTESSSSCQTRNLQSQVNSH